MPKIKRQSSLNKFGLGKERDYLFDDLSMMLGSGTPLGEALQLAATNSRNKKLRKILSSVTQGIDEGLPFWKALDATKAFSDYVISFVRVGESNGQLSENLQIIAQNEEKSRALKNKIRGALLYPAFVLCLTVMVAIGAVWFIFPRLAGIFSSFHTKLPVTTRTLIAFSNFITQNGILVLGGLTVFTFCLVAALLYWSPAKKIGHKFLLHIPGISRLKKEVEIERFGFLLGTMLQAGLTITESLESLIRATNFYPYRSLYVFLLEKIQEGQSIEQSFKAYKPTSKLIPHSVQEMITSGERSGKLPQTFIEVGNRYSKKTDVSSENIMNMMEPFMLVIVWLGVLGIALSVITPIYGLIGGLNQQTNATQPPTAAKIVQPEKLKVVSGDNTAIPIFAQPQVSSTVVISLKPSNGLAYKITKTQDGWYQIELPDGSMGWIQAKNAQIQP